MTTTNGKGPPLDVAPSELWAQITQLPRPARLVDFPAKDPVTGEPIGQVAIWALTQEELMICYANAARVAKDLLKAETTDAPSQAYTAIYQDACACEVLYRACRDIKGAPSYSQPAFPAPREVRRRLMQDQIATLFRAYLQVERELGPIVAALTPDELEAWIGRLAQAGNVFPLVSLSREALETLALSLALRLHASSTGTSSPGSPPDGGKSNATDPKPLPESPATSSESEFPDDEAALSRFVEDDPP